MRSKVSYCFRRCSCYRHSPPNAGYEVRVAYSAQPLWKRKSNISQTSRCWILDCREQTGAAPARISRAQENAVDYHDRGYDEVRPPTVARSGLRTSPGEPSGNRQLLKKFRPHLASNFTTRKRKN